MGKEYEKLKQEEMGQVGNKIRLFRIKENIKQKDLAKKLGLSTTQITNAENGKSQKAQDKVILMLKEKYDLPENYFSDKRADVKLLMEALAAVNIDDPDALLALFKEARNQAKNQVENTDQEQEAASSTITVPLVPETRSKGFLTNDMIKGKYMAILEGSITKVSQLKTYLEETDKKKLDKDFLLKIVNEAHIILSMKDDVL